MQLWDELVLMYVFLLYPVTRPANVPEGAHVQWEIELLGFEMQKVNLFIEFLAWNRSEDMLTVSS